MIEQYPQQWLNKETVKLREAVKQVSLQVEYITGELDKLKEQLSVSAKRRGRPRKKEMPSE